MDRHELCEALRAAGVPAGVYEIPDCPGPPGGPRSADRLYLEEQAGEWVAGVQQRGVRTVLKRFPDEDQACRAVYVELTDEGPQPSPLTPEETEELLHDSEGIQRRAREGLARALEATARQSPPGDAGRHARGDRDR
ncbi:hypothetical protein [Streptomyces sp. NBC_00829]|uniref:hypothetical protein n=1 Tax=Streptomyces sp. NBC_00829 TaxID=2903679 RepID=UPI00386B8F70|nr:hypothetical protein OG293_35420 [Streptomyces sp. NBC_00829]